MNEQPFQKEDKHIDSNSNSTPNSKDQIQRGPSSPTTQPKPIPEKKNIARMNLSHTYTYSWTQKMDAKSISESVRRNQNLKISK